MLLLVALFINNLPAMVNILVVVPSPPQFTAALLSKRKVVLVPITKPPDEVVPKPDKVIV